MSKRSSKKSKRRSKAVPALGITGLSLSLASGGRGRDAIVNAASLASCDIAILISRNWLASMGNSPQCAERSQFGAGRVIPLIHRRFRSEQFYTDSE
jgi:hypothetical protein